MGESAAGAVVGPANEQNPPGNNFDFGGEFLGPKELLFMAWGLYKSHFWKIFGAFVLPSVLIGAAAALMGAGIGVMGKNPAAGIAAISVWIILIAIIVPLQAIGILYMVDGAKAGMGIGEAYKKAWKKISSYWWLVWLEGLIVMGGFLPLLIPGIILSVQFMFSIYVLIFEDKGGLAAMIRSRDYVKGRWWAIFGRQMYVGLLMLAVAIPIGILTAVIAGGDKETAQRLEGIINLVFLPLTPLFIAYAYLIYKNLQAITPVEGDKPVKKTWWYLLAAWGMIGPAVMIGFMIMTFLKVFNLYDVRTYPDMNSFEKRIEFDQVEYPDVNAGSGDEI